MFDSISFRLISTNTYCWNNNAGVFENIMFTYIMNATSFGVGNEKR